MVILGGGMDSTGAWLDKMFLQPSVSDGFKDQKPRHLNRRSTMIKMVAASGVIILLAVVGIVASLSVGDSVGVGDGQVRKSTNHTILSSAKSTVSSSVKQPSPALLDSATPVQRAMALARSRPGVAVGVTAVTLLVVIAAIVTIVLVSSPSDEEMNVLPPTSSPMDHGDGSVIANNIDQGTNGSLVPTDAEGPSWELALIIIGSIAFAGMVGASIWGLKKSGKLPGKCLPSEEPAIFKELNIDTSKSMDPDEIDFFFGYLEIIEKELDQSYGDWVNLSREEANNVDRLVHGIKTNMELVLQRASELNVPRKTDSVKFTIEIPPKGKKKAVRLEGKCNNNQPDICIYLKKNFKEDLPDDVFLVVNSKGEPAIDRPIGNLMYRVKTVDDYLKKPKTLEKLQSAYDHVIRIMNLIDHIND